jgi:hypothetical protein
LATRRTKHQSTVKTGKIERLHSNLLIHKIGDLAHKDITEINNRLYQPIKQTRAVAPQIPAQRSRAAQKKGCRIVAAIAKWLDKQKKKKK